MAKHASFAPSSLSRVAACPGSWRATKDIKSKDSPYALEGRLAHEVAEKVLKNGGAQLRNYCEKGIILKGEEFTPLSEEMADAVQIYVDHVRGLRDSAEFLAVEKKLQIYNEYCWGTADAVVGATFDTLYVVDLKYGAGVAVDPRENWQCAAYLLGALKAYPDLMPTRAEIHIVQPRIDPAPKIWVVEDTQAFAREWEAKISDVIYAALQDDAPCVPGPHCQFCAATLKCEAVKKQSEELALGDYTENLLALPDLTTEELVAFHEKAEAVKIFMRAVGEELHKRALAGERVKGFKLVRSLGNLAWTTDEEELVQLFSSSGLMDEEFSTLKLKTPTQMKKILGKEIVDKHSSRPDRGIVLVPESDKRQPVVAANAANDFAEEDDFL